MANGSCHCGAVTVEVARVPAEVTSCNCSICGRLGTLWGYYAPAEVTIVGATATYAWGNRTIDFHLAPSEVLACVDRSLADTVDRRSCSSLV